ncbi:MAG: chromosome partitioning protein [Actinomycetota bacterium]|nr:chromosome partitioning protein [Actinomycetota bacterium]
MSIIVLASAKSSPGVTTACLALAAVWPQGRAVRIVEADPDGGSLGARLGVGSEPGLSTLAISSRRSIAEEDLARHSQVVPGGDVQVLVAPPTADQVDRSLVMLADRFVPHLRSPATDTLIDAGRLRPDTPAWPLVEAADAVLLVTRPRLDELQQLPARLRAARTTRSRVGVLLVGEEPYPAAEVAAALDTDVIGVLNHDPRGAAAVNGDGYRLATRSPLLRSARDLVDVLVTWVARPSSPAGSESIPLPTHPHTEAVR